MPYSERKEPTYQLLRVEDITASSFVLVFLQDTEYKKVIRYYTENYIRYPVYSNWLHERKEIKKKCASSLKSLEALPTHRDPLLSSFAYDIIALAYPSDVGHWPNWFQRERLTRIHEKKKKEILFSHQENQTKFTNALKDEEFALIKLTKSLEDSKKDLAKEQTNQKRIQEAKDQAEQMKKNVALDALSLGIRGYRHSSLRKRSLDKKRRLVESRIAVINQKISGFCRDVENHQKVRDSIAHSLEEDNEAYSKRNALNDAWLSCSLEGISSLTSPKKKSEETKESTGFNILDISID